ncbi:hypothetical protein SDC9_102489 [bioreactor metagenome]|uniref:Uncharacterized protein n=1 Tax=bioreactor metagenome TaxID=1076179 RepID=A0A645AR02_9ZZZZ
MDVLLGELVCDVRGDGLGLGDLLRLQPVALQHVLEVHVAADVQLVRTVDGVATLLEQVREHPVSDGGADLGLDVVTDDRQPGVLELLRPLRRARDEHRQGVDEGAARVDGALRVEPVRLLRPHRQVRDQDVGLGRLQGTDDIDRLGVRLGDGLAVVLAETVEGVAALDGDTGGRHVAERHGVVLAGLHRVGEVEADLLRVDVEGGDEVHVVDVVVAELHVHEAGDGVARIGVAVEVHALDQGRGTITDADDGDTDRVIGHVSPCSAG